MCSFLSCPVVYWVLHKTVALFWFSFFTCFYFYWCFIIFPRLRPRLIITNSYSERYPSRTVVDQDGYLAPITPQFTLSDPPLGHSTATDPSSITLTSNIAAPKNFLPQDTAGQYANNPVYGIGLSKPTKDIKETSENSEDSKKSQSSQLRGSRLQSTGSAVPCDSSSSFPLRGGNTDMTALDHSGSLASPLSPTGQSFGWPWKVIISFINALVICHKRFCIVLNFATRHTGGLLHY